MVPNLRLRPATFTTLLASAAVGVYLLVMIGATTAITDAAAACTTWPACRGRVVPPTDLRILVAWGHRLVAVLSGGLVLAAAVAGWRGVTGTEHPSADAGPDAPDPERSPRPRRVLAALAVPVVLYPVQIAIGAFAATTDAAWVSTLHLLAGIGIFAGLVLALAWQLEAEAPAADDVHASASAPPPTPVDGAAATGSTAAAAPAAASDDDRSAPDGSPAPSAAGAHASADTRSSRAAGREGVHGRVRATAAAYFRLMKPRLMWLLCLVAAAGMALAAGPDLRLDTLLATLGGGVLAIGASGTFNHVLERDVDERMARTADRPLASHEVPVRNAVAFGAVLAVASLVAFLQVNLLAAALGLTAILFYSVVYTLVLKPNTVQNTVIGGFAGSLPALIGWVAVTGRFGVPALALAGVIFLWTPAHFYNLALAYREDYERGGFPMLPVVRGETVTHKHILLYLAATLVGAAVLGAVTTLGWVYVAATVLAGAVFLWAAVRLHRERTTDAALRTFHASNAYLGCLLVAVLVDAIVV